MRTFDEAVKEVCCATDRAHAVAKAERQVAFMGEMVDNQLYRDSADSWAVWALCEVGKLPDAPNDDEGQAQVMQVLCTLVNSVFTWGLNVGRLMEAQEMPDA